MTPSNSSTNTPVSTPNDTRIALIGLGHMNGAILEGLLSAGHNLAAITATTWTSASAKKVSAQYGINVLAHQENSDANAQVAAQADVVLIGVKPPAVPETLRTIAAALKPDAVVVSVAAGVTLETLASNLNAGQPVIRTMPNIPLTVGQGVVGMTIGPTVTEEQHRAATAVFDASGTVFDVPEEKVNIVTALAGSGPGYVFYFTDLLAQAAKDLGLDADQADTMARLTVAGAGAMLAQPGADAVTLRDSIATGGGTTQAAVDSMNASGMPDVVAQALKANIQRSIELGS